MKFGRGLFLIVAVLANLVPTFAQKKVAADNELSKKEKEEGWMLLFDGKSLKGWHNYNSKTIGESWVVEDDAIHLKSDKKADGSWQAEDGGDILTDDRFDDFEFTLEWKIAPCGNSGIIYNIIESKKYEYPWHTGPEMQILDNTCHPDAKIVKHRAGDLYDLMSCSKELVKPAGEWNKIKIKKKDNRVQHWLNGEKVVDYTLGSKKWEELVAASKFKEYEAFGTASKGYIALQDHGDKVWFKNIKIRRAR